MPKTLSPYTWAAKCARHAWNGFPGHRHGYKGWKRGLKPMPIPSAQAPAYGLTIVPRNSLWVRFLLWLRGILGTRLW